MGQPAYDLEIPSRHATDRMGATRLPIVGGPELPLKTISFEDKPVPSPDPVTLNQ